MRTRHNTKSQSFLIAVAFTVCLYAFALGIDSNDDPGAYLIVCPAGTFDRFDTMCFP